eukprot:scaffold4962_cov151-Skeletonema_dohrnii-CCMP3373.AAC.2
MLYPTYTYRICAPSAASIRLVDHSTTIHFCLPITITDIMGKQKRNKSKRGSKQNSNKTALSASSATSSANEEKGASTIVSKIRHGDPRVRHAALVALSSTLFHSSSLSAAALQKERQQKQSHVRLSAKANKPVVDASDETLLRALSERILDVDIPCATAATGCLSNYVSFYCIGDAEESSPEAEVASEVMVPILFQRIQRSLDKITSLGSQIESSIAKKVGETANAASAAGAAGSSAIDKMFAFNTEQWILVSLSLNTLAGLIENFPSAVERVSAASLSTLCAVLPLVEKSIQLTKNGMEESNGDCILDASSNASRAIHSLLDDNIAIITSLQPTPLTHIVTELTNTITNAKMPHMTRLHASGALVSLRKVLVLDEELKSARGREYDAVVAAVQTCTDGTVIDLLSNLFESGDKNHDPKQLVLRMIELSNKCQSMKQDEMMESQIMSEVNARKEPARMIARRQKELKESKKTKAENEDMKEAMMVEDKDGVKKAEETESQLDDVKDELDGVVKSWRELIGSYKLALELVANLCSGREDQDDDIEDVMYPDDDEHMWDSDDEAKLVSAANVAGACSMEMTCSPSERVTFSSMSSKHLLARIIFFFRSWVEFVSMLKDDVPALVAEDVDELLSTCALCLGNMVACDLSSLNEPSLKKVIMVGGQEKPVTDGLDMFWWELIAAISSDVSDGPKAHVTSVMLALLRHQPKARTIVNSAVLDLLLALITQQYNAEGGANNVQMKCNAISMIGLLCSEPHPSEVNARVCSALLERLRSPLSSTSDDNDADSEKARQSLVIMHEILDVLMDMYGGDDSHDEVFGQQDVLGHFQRCLPGFKRRVKKTVANSTREELDTWNETALNCSRFIKYKKG